MKCKEKKKKRIAQKEKSITSNLEREINSLETSQEELGGVKIF